MIATLLSLAAIVAGAGLIVPICYWQGRAMDNRSVPGGGAMAYADRMASAHATMFFLGILWAVLWLLWAMRIRRRRYSPAYWAVPMVVFAYCGWEASRFAYACNPF